MSSVRDVLDVETNLQDGPLELGMALQVAVDHIQGKPVPHLAMIVMPEITKQNVGHYYNQLYADPQAFLDKLPGLIRDNLASGHYAAQ